VHVKAVEGALRYLERHALGATRRRGPEREVVATTGLVGGLFTHGVNRNLDPHLHSHVVVANFVHGVDGRWSACDWRGLTAHRPAAAAVYEAHLRDGLTAELGVHWCYERRPNATLAGAGCLSHGAEVAGLAPGLLGEFSSRSAEIRQRVHDFGSRTARGRHVAWAATRVTKANLPYEVLRAEWGRRARAVGDTLDFGRLSGLALRRPSATLDEHRYAAVITVTPHGGARRRDVVVAFGAAAPDGVPAPWLEHLVSRWVPENGSVGVAEPLHQRRAVLPANHLLHALGPRPTHPGAHDVWVDAARALDAYRARWGVSRAEEPLGQVTNLGSLPGARLADHLRTARHLDAARARLGLREPIGAELGLGL
jgi:hypothetical protein